MVSNVEDRNHSEWAEREKTGEMPSTQFYRACRNPSLDSDVPHILGHDELSASGKERRDSLRVLEQVADSGVWSTRTLVEQRTVKLWNKHLDL